VGFLDELLPTSPRRKFKKKGNPRGYPVYIDWTEVGELVVPPLPWWAVVLVVIGGAAGAASLLERLKRWWVR